LQLTSKISLEFDFSSSLLYNTALRQEKNRRQLGSKAIKSHFAPSGRVNLANKWKSIHACSV